MLRQKIIQAKKEIRLRRTGFAPVSPAWEADQLTTLITNRTLALSDLLSDIYIYIVYPHLDAQGARETYYYNGALCLRSYRSDARLPTEPG